MASAASVVKLFSSAAIASYDHDPGSTAAMITSPDGGTTKRYVPILNYQGFACIVTPTVIGGNGVTLVEIVGAEDAAGTNATAIVTSGAVQADALGDFVALECTPEQVQEVGRAAGYAFTHVGVRITCASAGDEAVVVYIRHGASNTGGSVLTATAIA